MTDIAYIGEIRLFAINFAPRDWAYCDGSLLQISQNQALYSLIGTIYGGDGRITFGLPDLRGRVPLHKGRGPGLRDYPQGQNGGMEMVQLTQAEMPSHTHYPQCSDQPGNQQLPANAVPADETNAVHKLYQTSADGVMLPTTSAGADQAHDNMQPYLAVAYCICLDGIYPPRS